MECGANVFPFSHKEVEDRRSQIALLLFPSHPSLFHLVTRTQKFKDSKMDYYLTVSETTTTRFRKLLRA